MTFSQKLDAKRDEIAAYKEELSLSRRAERCVGTAASGQTPTAESALPHEAGTGTKLMEAAMEVTNAKAMVDALTSEHKQVQRAPGQ